jgi:type I restriction enzyme R subunit
MAGRFTRAPRESIMKSLKGYAAYEYNRLLGLQGSFWQDESYDHVVRDDDELIRIIEYVENNPIKAGRVERREDWQWSSARDRARLSIPYGQPLKTLGGHSCLP